MLAFFMLLPCTPGGSNEKEVDESLLFTFIGVDLLLFITVKEQNMGQLNINQAFRISEGLISLEPIAGFEPVTLSLRMRCSTS